MPQQPPADGLPPERGPGPSPLPPSYTAGVEGPGEQDWAHAAAVVQENKNITQARARVKEAMYAEVRRLRELGAGRAEISQRLELSPSLVKWIDNRQDQRRRRRGARRRGDEQEAH